MHILCGTLSKWLIIIVFPILRASSKYPHFKWLAGHFNEKIDLCRDEVDQVIFHMSKNTDKF